MTISPGQNHRIETRLDLEATIFIEVLASESELAGEVILCNSLDLSANGLQVVVDNEIDKGSICRICIDLKDSDPIFLVGEVMWERPDDDPDAVRLGFLLFESDDSDIRRWKELVAEMLAS